MIGAIIGDLEGSVYEFHNIKRKDFDLYNPRCMCTDDSIMTLAVMEIMQNGWQNDRLKIVDTLRKWGRAYPHAGYGTNFNDWLYDDSDEPYHSCGNGSAMRVSAAGFYANSLDEARLNAIKVTEVTHNHPEGLKGAIVTAEMIYLAKTGATKEELREYAIKAYPEIEGLDYETLRRTYIHGKETCQVTLPQALYCFLISNSFEDCVRTTISIGGDCDTTAAINCAIAEAYYKDIPEDLIKFACQNLPIPKYGCDAYVVMSKYMEDRKRILKSKED